MDNAINEVAKRIVLRACKKVMTKSMKEASIDEFGVCGIDLSDPVNCLTIAKAARATK